MEAKPSTGMTNRAYPIEMVTIGLYCLETKTDNFAMNDQINQIQYIQNKIIEAAKSYGKDAPEFILSILLIPDWKNNSSYDNEMYKIKCELFFKRFRENIATANCRFAIQNAYDSASIEEKGFLYQLTNLGANADWIKTHAIISNANKKHLQLDSNTQIIDYIDLYKHTFMQNKSDGLSANEYDGLNASAYDSNTQYVSAHNKIVYTIPNGKIVKELTKQFLIYCSMHQNHNDPDKSKNSLYIKVFCPALANIGLTFCKEIKDPTEGTKNRYLVIFDRKEYELTKYIVTAINMTWSTEAISDPHFELKKLPPLKFKDAEITFPCFFNLINVHTAFFKLHENISSIEFFRTKLHSRDNDFILIVKYFLYIKDIRPDLLEEIVNIIPETMLGNKLCLDAFRCTKKNLLRSIITNTIQPLVTKHLLNTGFNSNGIFDNQTQKTVDMTHLHRKEKVDKSYRNRKISNKPSYMSSTESSSIREKMVKENKKFFEESKTKDIKKRPYDKNHKKPDWKPPGTGKYKM